MRRVAGAIVSALAIALLPFALDASDAAADATDARTLSLSLTSCADAPFSDSALRSKLAWDLHAEGVTLVAVGESASLVATLSFKCANDASGGALLLASNDGVRIDRRIEWGDVAAADRPAVIALAISETVRALAAMSPSPPPTVASASAAIAPASSVVVLPPVAPPLPSTAIDDAPSIPPPRADGAHARFGASLGGELLRFSDAPFLYGGRIEGTYGAVRIGFGAMTASASDPLGNVSVTLLRAIATLRVFEFTRAAWSADALVAGSLGRVAAHATAGSSASARDAEAFFASVSVGAAFAWSLTRGVKLGVAVDGGFARGVDLRTDARDLAHLEGAFAGARIELGWSP